MDSRSQSGPKIFRHYKGKYYRKLGEAIHSETLERYIYYECLYENPSGQFWIRPQPLFEGFLENGDHRFKPLPVLISRAELKTSDGGQLEKLDQVLEPLMVQTLGRYDRTKVQDRIHRFFQPTLWTAQFEEKIVGFKLGYSEEGETFYSWLGGVLPASRRYGIAQALMDAQHSWARDKKFVSIKTKTTLDRHPMLCLNLKNGFRIQKIEATDSSNPKIVLEKMLNLDR